MKILKPLFFIISLLSFSVSSLYHCFAADVDDLHLNTVISEMRSAKSPQIIDQIVLFSFINDKPIRYVGIAFEHEDFYPLHIFKRNSHDVFVFPYPIPSGTRKLVYRIVADGVWLADPHNPNQTVDRHGTQMSVVSLPPEDKTEFENPIVHQGNIVEFRYISENNQKKEAPIFITGTFNNWDPFMYRLQKIDQNLYSIVLRIPPGTHSYYFISNGVPTEDPRNRVFRFRKDGTVVSVFRVSQGPQ